MCKLPPPPHNPPGGGCPGRSPSPFSSGAWASSPERDAKAKTEKRKRDKKSKKKLACRKNTKQNTSTIHRQKKSDQTRPLQKRENQKTEKSNTGAWEMDFCLRCHDSRRIRTKQRSATIRVPPRDGDTKLGTRRNVSLNTFTVVGRNMTEWSWRCRSCPTYGALYICTRRHSRNFTRLFCFFSCSWKQKEQEKHNEQKKNKSEHLAERRNSGTLSSFRNQNQRNRRGTKETAKTSINRKIGKITTKHCSINGPYRKNTYSSSSDYLSFCGVPISVTA